MRLTLIKTPPSSGSGLPAPACAFLRGLFEHRGLFLPALSLHLNGAPGDAAAGGDHRRVEHGRELIFLQGFLEVAGQLEHAG